MLTDELLTRIPNIDDVLDAHATELGHDFFAYRNHVYRIVNLCVAIAGRSELEKIAVAAVFHDLGIWTDGLSTTSRHPSRSHTITWSLARVRTGPPRSKG